MYSRDLLFSCVPPRRRVECLGYVGICLLLIFLFSFFFPLGHSSYSRVSIPCRLVVNLAIAKVEFASSSPARDFFFSRTGMPNVRKRELEKMDANRRAVGMLNLLRQNNGGICGHGLSRRSL